MEPFHQKCYEDDVRLLSIYQCAVYTCYRNDWFEYMYLVYY